MRAQWNDEDLRRASRGTLLFTAQQAALIRAEVSTRNKMQQSDTLAEIAARN
jgi:hypothetical protein